MQKKSFSWGAIALMLCLFFPIGIWMIVKKVTTEKFNYKKNGQSLKTLGVVLFCFAGIYLIMAITESSSMLSAVVIFVGFGAFSWVKGVQYVKKGTKYNRYVSIINSGRGTFIDDIAAAYPTTYEKAAEDIQTMIDDGYFMNAYIDLSRRELVMPRSGQTGNASVNQNAVPVQSQPQSVKCKNCGATNAVIPGAANECEYCGSPL